MSGETRYFRNTIIPRRPYVTVERCRAVIDDPVRREEQPDGRIRFWGEVDLNDGTGGRIMRVVTLADGTLHNAFIDRGFRNGPEVKEDI